jgi:hypothetical protein
MNQGVTFPAAVPFLAALIVGIVSPKHCWGAGPAQSVNMVSIIVHHHPMTGPQVSAADVKQTLETLAQSYRTVHGANNFTMERPIDVSLQDVAGNNQIGKESLFAKIDEALVRVSDATTVLFYFIGHGDVDTTMKDRRRLFLDGGDFVYRDQVLNRLTASKARLVVFITESCASRSPQGPVPPVIQYGPQQVQAAVFETLFVKPSHVVDIASSTFQRNTKEEIEADELSWCPPDGGLFSKALIEVISDINPAAALNGTNLWPAVYCRTRSLTNQKYASFRKNLLAKWPNLQALTSFPMSLPNQEANKLIDPTVQQLPQAFLLAGGPITCPPEQTLPNTKGPK